MLLPVVIVVVLAEVSEGGMDARVLAILGVLSAVNALMRALGAGTAGIELVFFLLILAGRVFGPGFGFVLGCTSLFASALLTAGVGPWLPYQMLCSAWVGMGAGLLPRRLTGRRELLALIGYGVFAAYAFGILMNLSGWPLLTGIAVNGQEGGAGVRRPARRCWRTCTGSRSTRCSPPPPAGTPAARSRTRSRWWCSGRRCWPRCAGSSRRARVTRVERP